MVTRPIAKPERDRPRRRTDRRLAGWPHFRSAKRNGMADVDVGTRVLIVLSGSHDWPEPRAAPLGGAVAGAALFEGLPVGLN